MRIGEAELHEAGALIDRRGRYRSWARKVTQFDQDAFVVDESARCRPPGADRSGSLRTRTATDGDRRLPGCLSRRARGRNRLSIARRITRLERSAVRWWRRKPARCRPARRGAHCRRRGRVQRRARAKSCRYNADGCEADTRVAEKRVRLQAPIASRPATTKRFSRPYSLAGVL